MGISETSGLEVRAHQKEAVNSILDAIRSEKTRCVVWMTHGSGATYTLALTLKELFGFSTPRVLVVVDRKDIALQVKEIINEVLLGLVNFVSIKTIQSLNNKTEALSEFDIVFSLGLLGQSLERLSEWRRSDPLFILTNTPILGKDKDFGELIYRYSFQDAIDDNVVLPLKLNLGINFIESSQEERELIFDSILSQVRSHAEKKFLVTCESRVEANIVYDYFTQVLGSESTVLYTSDVSDREANLKRFRLLGETRIIVVVDMLLTGFEMPELTDIILLRKLASHTLMQAIARVNRRGSNKEYGEVWDFGKNDFNILDGLIFSEVEELVIGGKKTVSDTSIIQRRITPIGDQPTDNDLLNRGQLVHILKGIIESQDSFKPLNIGLFGRWGTGKSTVIELLRTEFKNNSKYYFVSFNAWENEHCDSMSAAIANSIADSLYFKRSIIKKLWFNFLDKFWLRKDEWSYTLLITFLVSAGIFIFNNTSPTDVKKALSDVNSISSLTGYIAIFSLVIGFLRAGFKNPLTQTLVKLIKNERYKKSLGNAQELKESITSLLKAACFRLFEDDKETILIIDDLDRCSSDKILQTIEAVRLLVGNSNVIILYAVDKSTLLNAVNTKYEKESSLKPLKKARDFLGKIFQLVVELEKPTKGVCDKFIFDRLYKSARTEGSHNVITGNTNEHSNQDVPLSERVIKFDELSVDEYEYIENDEYLEPAINEAEFFSYYNRLFEIENPRTLIRLHNTVTFMKGLYPEIVINNTELKVYIFFIFLHEYTCEHLQDVDLYLSQFINLNEAELPKKLHDKYKLFKSEFSGLSSKQLTSICSRVEKLSLPHSLYE